jgi:hypothetical protein
MVMTIFSDASHDAHTDALGVWAITPTRWRLLAEEWKAMLETIAMPNGEPCPAFHASAMMNQKGSFKGREAGFRLANRRLQPLGHLTASRNLRYKRHHGLHERDCPHNCL